MRGHRTIVVYCHTRMCGNRSVGIRRFAPTSAGQGKTARSIQRRPLPWGIVGANRANHTEQTRDLHAYLTWRNANGRHPDVLAAARRERARIRSEKGLRWGGRARQDLTLAA